MITYQCIECHKPMRIVRRQKACLNPSCGKYVENRGWISVDAETYYEEVKCEDLSKRSWTLKEQQEEANIYLVDIHNQSDSNRINLHTFFYYLNFEACPICNEWLVSRALPELEA